MPIDIYQQALNFEIKNSLFECLSEHQLHELLSVSVVKKYHKKQLILNRDNCLNSVYFLLDGILQVGYMSAGGRFHALSYFSDKNVINVIPCLEQQVLDYDYYAFNSVCLLVIPADNFLAMLQKNQALMQKVLALIALRMRQLLIEIKFLQTSNLQQKLCHLLLKLSNQYGDVQGQDIEIKLALSQSDLADLLSVSRQTVNKEMRGLIKSDVIDWYRKNIVIKNKSYLEFQIKYLRD